MYLTTRVAACLIAIAIAAVLSPAPVPVAVGASGLLLALCTADVLRAPSPRALSLSRDLPRVLTIGTPGRVALLVQNPTPRTLVLALRDAAPPSIGREPLRHTARVDAGRRIALGATVRPARRGLMALGPVTIRVCGPWGLAGRQRTVPLPGRLKVYPALPSRREVETRLERARQLQSGERSSTIRGGGTEFDALREYHPDDEFRRINWRATARAAKPVTNIYREERNQSVTLLLDAGRMMATTLEGVPRFEYAIDAAFAIAELASRAGDHVGMLAFAGDVVAMVGPRGGPSQPRRILDALYDVEPSLEAADYRRAFSTLLGRHRRRSLLVLLTDLMEESAQESLFTAMPALVRRHLVLVGSVTDASIERIARAVPEDSETAYLKAAAAGALERREDAAARLIRMGVGVVDQPPGRLAAALADRYLRIKAYGRL